MEENHFKIAGAKGRAVALARHGVESFRQWGKLGGRPKKKIKKDMSHSGSFPTLK